MHPRHDPFPSIASPALLRHDPFRREKRVLGILDPLGSGPQENPIFLTTVT
jgi:hypothetical protein